MIGPGLITASAVTSTAWNPHVSCTATLVNLTDITGSSGSLSGSPWQTSSTAGGLPNKRALSPPCSITNTSGQTIGSHVQINGVYLPSLIDEDCTTTYNSVNGGGSYPDNNKDGKPDTFCDTTGNIHPIGSTASIHIEFDHDWKAKGYCGPGISPCDNRTIAQYFSSGSKSLDVQGFVYWDNNHWELHPFTGWKLSSAPAPSPLSTSFSYSPSNPSPGTAVSFTGTATGGTSPYTFSWTFGDGGSATGGSTAHTYSIAGSYNVILTAKDSGGQTATSSQTVKVGAQSSYTFTPTDDSYVQQDTPTTNYGTSSEITVDNSPVKNILLKFNVQVPGQITGATLRLYQVDSSDRGGDFHTAPSNWTETTATWNNAPPPNPTVFFSLGPVSPNTWYDVDMTSVSTGNGIVSLRVTSPSTDGSHFSSKEGGFPPQLVVSVASGSNAPPNLTVPSAKTVNELAPLSFNVLATDDTSQTITLTAAGLPNGASFISTPAAGSATGTFNWTPSEAQGPGTYTVTFTAQDSLGAKSTGSVTITVNEVNSSPAVSAPSTAAAPVGSTTTFVVTGTDSDLPANTVTLSATGLVSGMTFPTATGNPASATFSFTPSQSQLGMTFTVTFTAADNGSPSLSTSKTTTISVATSAAPYGLVIGDDGNVFRLQGGTLTLLGQPTTQPLRQVSWRPDGAYALIVGHGATLIKYDGTQFSNIATGIATSANFHSVAWKPDGSMAIIVGSPGIILTYDGTSVASVSSPTTNSLRSVSWHPSGNSALIVGRGGTMLLYQNGAVSAISSGTTSDLFASAWNPTGSYALAAGANGVILRYDGTTVQALNTASVYSSSLTLQFVSWNPAGTLALLVGDSGLLLTYDGGTLTSVTSLTVNGLYSVDWLGTTAYIAGSAGTILTYSGGVVTPLSTGSTSTLRGIAWKPS